MNYRKILHLIVEINQTLLEGLPNMSMSTMAISVIRELGIMHLVSGHETFKTTFAMLT